MVGVDRSGVGAGRPTFVAADVFSVGSTCTLDEHAARHMRVLRLDAGAIIGLRDGQGTIGQGVVVRLMKSQAVVEVTHAVLVEPLPPVHLLVPIADRDRMLWLAEKACEFACTSWRPVLWRRSRSVSPRGEGLSFHAKVAARMAGALAQSEGAWLPQLFPDATLDRALLAAPVGDRVTLDPEAPQFTGASAAPMRAPMVIALGPEGGFEKDELDALDSAGFRRVSVGSTILRFETAGIAALAIARTALSASAESSVNGASDGGINGRTDG